MRSRAAVVVMWVALGLQAWGDVPPACRSDRPVGTAVSAMVLGPLTLAAVAVMRRMDLLRPECR